MWGSYLHQGAHFRICSDANNLQKVHFFPAHQQVRAYWVGVEQELPRKRPVHNYRNRFPSTITDFEVPATQDGNTSCSTSPHSDYGNLAQGGQGLALAA